jgi:hypothetical protein
MAYRKAPWRKLRASQILPIWTRSETNAVTLAFQALLSKFGISDIPSYFRQWPIPISISVVVCACIGAATFGFKGFVLGGLSGLALPAAAIFVTVLLVGVTIYLAIFFAAWAVILGLAKWFLSGLFGG